MDRRDRYTVASSLPVFSHFEQSSVRAPVSGWLFV